MPSVDRVLDSLINGNWAILPHRLKTMYMIAKRETNFSDEKLKALAKESGEKNENNGRIVMRGSVGVIDVRGPIFRHANLFTAISGATSTDLLAQAITDATTDPNVSAILLNIDSPGGEVSGIHELVGMIKQAAAKMPIYSYIESTGASAAYWLASATSKIYIDPTALVGSIGVVSTFRKATEDNIEIVSSNAPKKRVDPETEEGQSQIRSVIDDIAAVFTEDVAANRAVDIETVNKKFGEGGVVVGKSAVAVGMVDGLSSFEEVLSMLSEMKPEGGIMPEEKTSLTADEIRAQHPELISQIVQEELSAATSELSEQVTQLRLDNLKKDLKALVGKDTAEFLMGYSDKLDHAAIMELAAKFQTYEATINDLGKSKGEDVTPPQTEKTEADIEAEVAALAGKKDIPLSEAWAEYMKNAKQQED